MFNKEAYIAKMKVPVGKLIKHFKERGIDFIDDDGFGNVVFAASKKQIPLRNYPFTTSTKQHKLQMIL